MRCHRISVLFILAVGSFGGTTTPVAPDWDIVHVKHAWRSIPKDWESLGPPPVGTTINLRIGLKPHNEQSLIDVLYEVSNPRHPKCVLSRARCPQMLTYAVLFQIWSTSVKGAGR